MSKAPGEYRTPLGPATEAIGAPGTYPLSARYPSGDASPNTTLTPRQGSKDSGYDPSVGTASVRPVSLERNGAAFRVRHEASPYAAPNHPSAVYTQPPHGAANTEWVEDQSVQTADKNYPKGENKQFHTHVALYRDGQQPYLG